jgi:phage N-6-adenine-methyltransferase|tara:strand:- start:92 stop:580 length:489 start_codon:yes stop_codon:yes gene_type:complete
MDIKNKQTVHFLSTTDDWSTPQWLFNALDREFGFTLDPCSSDTNFKCDRHFTVNDNGLLKSWENEVVFMNPPYGTAIKQWMGKAHDAATNHGATVVCLVPSRTDTEWWHRYAMKNEIRFFRGRLSFGEGAASAPFPSAVVVMRPVAFKLFVAERQVKLPSYG